MKVSSSVRFAAPLLLCMLALSHAQEQPPLGVPVPPLGAGPWVFDTAEQHKVRVSVVTKGLSHPWAIAFLPDGGMLVTGRPGRLRIVRDGVLESHAISGVPTVRPGFPFCPPDQGLCTPTRLSARQISSSHVVPLPAEAALDVEPTRAPAFRAVLRHRSTLVPFLRQAASLHSSRVSLPGQVAPRSSAACRRTAAGSDALPPGGASSTLRASPAGPRSSPAAAGDS